MAAIETIEVGLTIKDPNWKLICFAIAGHSMRALGQLEGDRPDLALASLQDAKAVGDLAMMFKADFQNDESSH